MTDLRDPLMSRPDVATRQPAPNTTVAHEAIAAARDTTRDNSASSRIQSSGRIARKKVSPAARIIATGATVGGSLVLVGTMAAASTPTTPADSAPVLRRVVVVPQPAEVAPIVVMVPAVAPPDLFLDVAVVDVPPSLSPPAAAPAPSPAVPPPPAPAPPPPAPAPVAEPVSQSEGS